MESPFPAAARAVLCCALVARTALVSHQCCVLQKKTKPTSSQNTVKIAALVPLFTTERHLNTYSYLVLAQVHQINMNGELPLQGELPSLPGTFLQLLQSSSKGGSSGVRKPFSSQKTSCKEKPRAAAVIPQILPCVGSACREQLMPASTQKPGSNHSLVFPVLARAGSPRGKWFFSATGCSVPAFSSARLCQVRVQGWTRRAVLPHLAANASFPSPG